MAMAKKPKKIKDGRGRPKLYGIRILLPLPDEMLVDIDAVRGDSETRVDLMRSAIEREIKRRAKT